MAKFLNFNGDYNGITEQKAEQNLNLYGENIFHETEDKSFGALRAVINPWTIILAAAAIVYFILGEIAAGLTSAAFAVAVMVALAVFCESCNRKISECTANAKMKYRVIREGEMKLIPAQYITPDDIIIVQGGETAPADAHILEADNLKVDESRFSGRGAISEKRAGSDNSNNKLKSTCIYAGTRILSGGCVARVFATGEDAYISVNTEKRGRLPDPDFSPYEKVYAKAKPYLVSAAFVVTLIGVGVMLLLGRGDSMSDAITALGWLLCLMPPFAELFIRAYSIKSAERIAKKGAAIKHLGDIYKLNGLTTIVLDKSAVVSEGLEVAGVYTKNHKLMTDVTILAGSFDNPTPTEQAFLLAAALGGTDIKEIKANKLVRSYPYSDTGKIGGNLYEFGDKRLFCVKGTAETVAGLCDISPDEVFEIEQRTGSLCAKGMEVWLSAYTILPADSEPKSIYSERYKYMGMVSYISSTRDTVPLAVGACKRAGIQLALISSDNPETAAAMGRKLGLDSNKMVTGEDLQEGVIEGKTQEIASAHIFGGVTGEQKRLIIKRLQESGKIVAAYGRSDEDYDTVTAADLGITSLEQTSGSVYEACGLIIAQDSFAGIVEIINEARRLHRNIKKCLSLFLCALIVLLFSAVADMITGAGVFNVFMGSILVGAVLPILATSFVNIIYGAKTATASSKFLGRGQINRKFILSNSVAGILEGIYALIAIIVAAGLMPSGEVSSMLLILLTSLFASDAIFAAGSKVTNSIIAKAVITVIAVTTFIYLITLIPVSLFYGMAMPNLISLIVIPISAIVAFLATWIRNILS